MCIDRPVDSKAREALIEWVRAFLCQFDMINFEPGHKGMLNEEAAQIIFEVFQSQSRLLCDEQNYQSSLPNPASFFHNQEDQ